MEEKERTQYKFILASDENSKHAIKVTIRGVEYIVEPYQIFNSIYRKKGYFLLFLNGKDYCSNKATLRVDTEVKGYGINWIISTANGPWDILPAFDISIYINNVKEILDKLLTAINEGEPVLYNDKRKFRHKYNLQCEINGMCLQIKNTKAMLLTPYPRLCDVKIEEFSFRFVEEYSCDTTYEITLGERKYLSSLSDWSNELEHIRYMLEGICYERKAEIKICFEDAPATIILEESKVRANNNTYSIEDDYKIIEVTVIPDSFVKGPILYGYCQREQVVNALYQGLLKLAMRHSNWFDNEPESSIISWDKYKMVIYNKLKSPIVEDYINKIGVKEYSFRNRQRVIKRIFTIDPDYDITVLDEESCTYYCENDDTLELCIDDNENYITINIPGLYQWQQEFENATDFTETKTKDNFDWLVWHKRGMVLAKQLREKLPPSCDLWYSAPYEDKSGTIKDKILIL